MRQPGAASPRVRLYCFPYAGGSGAVFSGWGERLKPEVEVWAAQPRGRGMRFRETPFDTVDAMVAEYLEALRASMDLPYAFYGHSLGGLVALELTQRLTAEGFRAPEHLFVGASPPPHLGLLHEEIGHLPDEGFVEAIQQRYGGIPSEVLQEPELMALFLPALKADFAAYERFRFGKTRPVDCPLTVFAGAADAMLAEHVMDEWERHTTGAFEKLNVAGDHFFLTASGDRVLARIRAKLHEGPRDTARTQVQVGG